MARDQDQRLLTLVGCIRGVVLEFDADVRYVNAWADDPALLAKPAAEMIGKTIEEVLGREAGAPFTAMVRRVFATGIIEHLEYPLDLEGKRRWFSADVKRVNAPETVVFFARDITDRREAEDALARSEERFRLAALATNDILWDWDLTTDQVMWNAAAKSLGYDALTTTAISWKEAIHPDDRPHVLAQLGAVLGGEANAWTGRYRCRRADGSYGTFLDRGFISRNVNGKPVRMVGSMTDVTQLDRLQAQLMQADRMAALGTLAAGVGHEINNPLSYVMGNIDIALELLDDSAEEIREALREAHDGSRRIAEIVKSLKRFTRSDDQDTRALDVHEIFEAAAKMADKEIRRRATLVREYGTPPLVRANEAQLGQVFLNLLLNASQAIGEDDPHRNQIRVRTGVDDRGCVTVTISDTGCGIEPELLASVFDPFFTTKPIGTGTGLGLSICHDIVQKLGGEITVASEVGFGTSFTVALPAVAAVPASMPRVLVIDDEVQIGRLITRVFAGHAQVTTVTRARAALELLARERFDLVLCDVMMPEMTGIDLYDELLRSDPGLLRRVYFMTGGAFTPRAQQFLDAIGAARLDKPIERKRLLALLASVSKDASRARHSTTGRAALLS